MKEKKVTIKEVAALAGVSISSVSRYLADPKSIQPLAAYNIKNAIRELQYEPNSFAQNLKRGKSNIVGLVVPHMEYFFGKVCGVVSDYFYERRYVTFVCETDSDGAKERFYIQELLNQKAAGIIVAPSGQNTQYLQNVARNYKNLIAIDRLEDIGCDIVLENHRENAYRLLSWLLKNKPCHQILMLFGWVDSYNTRMCLAGSGQAFEENGKKESEILRIFTARKIEVVMDALERLAARVKPGERPLIVAFGSDILEYVVMGLHQRYPEWIGRVDVAGFAQAGTADKLGIECSLVIKNPESVGITAAELLHKKLIGEKKEDTTRVYDIKVQDQF
ncbi:MAG: LacI family transcriptional regulator [Lachnospiraceae bacterium]|nr:LacI family transcriptional regulator [Lachnospiraceae bacterium]